MSLRTKLILSMSSVAAVLLLSSVISVIEYRRMSNYVTSLIKSNISSINMANTLSSVTEKYNLEILAVIGEDSLLRIPQIDQQAFTERFDSLCLGFKTEKELALADSVAYAYSAYMMTALELETAYNSTFINTRDWYFDRLQPRFVDLRRHLDSLVDLTYNELSYNSETFQQGFYRSIVPGFVAVAAAILLVLLLMFFILVYYVNPLYKMLQSLKNFRDSRIPYNCNFEGEDELSQLNECIADLTSENKELLRRIKNLKNRHEEDHNTHEETENR